MRLSPSLARAHFGIGVVLEIAPATTREAIDAFTAAVRSDPVYDEARFSLANALRRTGRVGGVAAALRGGAASDNPATSQASFGYAMGLVRLGRYREARDRLERDARVFRRPAGFCPRARARAGGRAGRSACATGARAGAGERRSPTTQRSPAIAETMAMAFAETGRFDEAVRWQSEALDDGAAGRAPPTLVPHLDRQPPAVRSPAAVPHPVDRR